MDREVSPAAIVAGVEAGCRRIRTRFDGGEMTWRMWGEGPLVLLLHGGHGSWTHWLHTIPALARDRTVLVPDMPGYGDSDAPRDPYSPMSLATAVSAGLGDILAPGQEFAIAGFSFGGTIGGYIADQRRDRVCRLVLVGAGGLGLRSPDRPLMRDWRRMETPEAQAAAHRTNLARLMIADPGRIDALALHLQQENARRTRINSRQFSPLGLLAGVLRTLETPLGGIYGSMDILIGRFMDQRRAILHEVDPHAPFVVLDGAGHWVQFEDPDRFNPALTAMLP